MHWQIKSFSATCENGKGSINKGKIKLLKINFKPASGTWCSVNDFTSLSTSCDPMSFSCLLSLHQSFQLWMNKTIQPNLVSRTFGKNRVQGPWLLSTITGDWAATWGHFKPKVPKRKECARQSRVHLDHASQPRRSQQMEWWRRSYCMWRTWNLVKEV